MGSAGGFWSQTNIVVLYSVPTEKPSPQNSQVKRLNSGKGKISLPWAWQPTGDKTENVTENRKEAQQPCQSEGRGMKGISALYMVVLEQENKTSKFKTLKLQVKS